MPWYLYLAFKQLFPSGRKVSFFLVLSVVGVSLGVCLLVVVLSVMNGFQKEIRDKIVETQGDIRVEAGAVIYDYDGLMETISGVEFRQEKVIQAVSPYAYGFVMVQNKNVPVFPQIRGVDVTLEEEIVPFEKFMKSGTIEDLDDDSVIISSGLARKIGAFRGDVLEVVSPLIMEKFKQDEIMLPRELRIVGVFETGWTVIDNNTLFCTLSLMQEFYGLEDGVHGITVRLMEGYEEKVDLIAAEINHTLSLQDGLPLGVKAFSWLDLNRDFLFVLQLEKSVMFFLLLFIVLVSAFAITSTLLITVMRKTKEIGLLGAMGATPGGLIACFTLQGFIIGVAGTLFGIAFALIALAYRNEIVKFVAGIFNKEETLIRFYQFTHLPADYRQEDFVIIIICAIVVSTLAGLIPAFRASRLKPASALRSE
ncbi:MAG: ABC transporter permease [Verrucomicrobia bacterium]|nr:ABC transporter permease [Verrucomicrobiota bacterium]